MAGFVLENNHYHIFRVVRDRLPRQCETQFIEIQKLAKYMYRDKYRFRGRAVRVDDINLKNKFCHAMSKISVESL
jgi:hypothetical protein